MREPVERRKRIYLFQLVNDAPRSRPARSPRDRPSSGPHPDVQLPRKCAATTNRRHSRNGGLYRDYFEHHPG